MHPQHVLRNDVPTTFERLEDAQNTGINSSVDTDRCC